MHCFIMVLYLSVCCVCMHVHAGCSYQMPLAGLFISISAQLGKSYTTSTGTGVYMVAIVKG